MKRFIGLLLVAGTLLSIVACAPAGGGAAVEPAEGGYDALIGFAMPTHSDESWLKHKTYMQTYLEEMGYTNFDEQWAEDVVADQVSQIENMITKGVKCWSSRRSMAILFPMCSQKQRNRVSKSWLMIA